MCSYFRLAPEGSFVTTDGKISTKFVIQSVANNKLLDMEKFKLSISVPKLASRNPSIDVDFDTVPAKTKRRIKK